ncbi:hypothetical protein C8R43DRAFT_1042604 [Mycena crocata]|nr:hypothetical protein C8R43DRAFT_1042604 [Mycena crocata]
MTSRWRKLGSTTAHSKQTIAWRASRSPGGCGYNCHYLPVQATLNTAPGVLRPQPPATPPPSEAPLTPPHDTSPHRPTITVGAWTLVSRYGHAAVIDHLRHPRPRHYPRAGLDWRDGRHAQSVFRASPSQRQTAPPSTARSRASIARSLILTTSATPYIDVPMRPNDAVGHYDEYSILQAGPLAALLRPGSSLRTPSTQPPSRFR